MPQFTGSSTLAASEPRARVLWVVALHAQASWNAVRRQAQSHALTKNLTKPLVQPSLAPAARSAPSLGVYSGCATRRRRRKQLEPRHVLASRRVAGCVRGCEC